uniref:BTB domain-containing protein n=1 Tax=Glossina pallidipes TaxID=7398 RepID=A0A1A9ZCF1_GLOPL
MVPTPRRLNKLKAIFVKYKDILTYPAEDSHTAMFASLFEPTSVGITDGLTAENNCKNADYGTALLEVLNRMRLNQEHCDFSLQVDGETIFVHKWLLAAASPYFEAMLRNDVKEKAQGTAELIDIDASAVKAVVEYIYSGSIQITESNALPLLSAADLLQIDWVKEQCCELLKRVLKPENCFSLQKYAAIFVKYKDILTYPPEDRHTAMFASTSKPTSVCITDGLMAENNCKNPDYGTTLLETLNRMRLNQEHCDFSLQVDGETIFVHKWLLAAASPYFGAMLRNDMKEKAQGTAELIDIDASAVKAVVEYIYSGSIQVTESNALPLLSAANLLQIDWVKEQCYMHSCADLCDHCHKYILENFQLLTNTEEWLLLSFEEIEKLMKDDKLRVKVEDNAYKALIKWIKHDQSTRQVHLSALMGHIRLPFISTEFLTNHIITEPLLRNDLQCSHFLIDALSYQLLPESGRKCLSSATHNEKRIKSRNEIKHYVLFVGGERIGSWETLSRCEIYNISSNKVIPTSKMKTPRCEIRAATLNGRVFTAGGTIPSHQYSKTAECYNASTQKWTDIASMNDSHSSYGICAHNDLIYVIGGRNTSTVECYNPTRDQWHNCAKLPLIYYWGNRVAVVENCIFNCGGFRDSTQHTSSVTRYDPREGRWYDVKPTSEKISRTRLEHFEVVPYKHFLISVQNHSQRFDVRCNKWEDMPSMHFSRAGQSAVIIDEEIYVFGGRTDFDSSTPVTSVERFNFNTNKWTIVDSVKIEHRIGGAAVISDCFDFSEVSK